MTLSSGGCGFGRIRFNLYCQRLTLRSRLVTANLTNRSQDVHPLVIHKEEDRMWVNFPKRHILALE